MLRSAKSNLGLHSCLCLRLKRVNSTFSYHFICYFHFTSFCLICFHFITLIALSLIIPQSMPRGIYLLIYVHSSGHPNVCLSFHLSVRELILASKFCIEVFETSYYRRTKKKCRVHRIWSKYFIAWPRIMNIK